MASKAYAKDDLGRRMKEYYEGPAQAKLYRRTPVAIRIDGKAFHTFTKHFAKPFDSVMMQAMQETTRYLCENIQGCVLGYTQSDEITLILIDYKTLASAAWYDYKVQKLCSVSASMATCAFNRIFASLANVYIAEHGEADELSVAYRQAMEMGAMFDSRCFNIPKEEVTNLVYWRQLDAARNSVQMVGHAHFSQKEMKGKANSEVQDMLMDRLALNWNDLPTSQKRGTCVVRGVDGGGWIIDEDIPQFRGENRDYIEKLLLSDEE